jgi:predicted dehydrogenase
MKFLIAGFGSIGRRHFRNLLALGERDILFYRSKQSTLADDELANFVVETDLQAALAHQPEAVIISNPTALHLDVAIPAAEQGCHLFLEKPISHNLDRIDELQAALQKDGGRVLVGFQFRFHPGLELIFQIVKASLNPLPTTLAPSIGRPISARAHWGEYLPNWHPWEDYRQGYSARQDLGGGVVLTLCHPLDYLRWLFGDVQKLWAFTAQSSDLELPVEDTAEIGLRFKNGMTGTVHLDYCQQPASHRLEIIGTQGTIRWDNADGIVKISNGQAWQEFPPPENFDRNDLFRSQMQHFVEVVNGTVDPICSLNDGIKALELALAVHESSLQEKIIRLAV